MHSVYHFYLVNQPNFVFIIFKISCSCALYSLHLECNLSPHLVIKIIIYIQSNFFRRYIIISMIPILTNQNNTIKFTSRYSLITSPSTAIPERLPSKNIWEVLSHIFLYRFIASAIITIIIANIKIIATIAKILIPQTSPPYNLFSDWTHYHKSDIPTIHKIEHFSSFFDHKFTTFTTNLTLLYNTRQNDWYPGKPVRIFLLHIS